MTHPPEKPQEDDVAGAIDAVKEEISQHVSFRAKHKYAHVYTNEISAALDAVKVIIRAAEENAGLRTKAYELQKIADTNAHASNEYMKMRNNLSTENYHLRKENAGLRACEEVTAAQFIEKMMNTVILNGQYSACYARAIVEAYPNGVKIKAGGLLEGEGE